MRRPTAWIALGIVLVLAGVAAVWLGTAGDETPVTVPAGAAAGDLTLEPCTYRVGRGWLRADDYAADCGTLVVPENRSDPGARLIALPVKRIRATGGDQPAAPIFHLAGGPGVTNLRFSRLQGLIQHHDLVLVGYRGVDGSVRLDCPEVSAVFADPPGDWLSEAGLERIAQAHAQCAQRLRQAGVDTDGYTVVEVVDDLEQTRLRLGYDRIHLLSQSYGTRLAMIYAWRYPESIHRSAMISVNPPGHFIWQPEVTDAQIRYYAGLCRRDPECSARTDDLAATMRQVAADLPRRWLLVPIKRGNVLAGSFLFLYHTGSAGQVFDAWLAAAEGDPSGLAVISLMVGLMFPSASVWGESAAKVTSTDYQYDPGRDFRAEMMPPGSILGAPVSLLGWRAAAGWPGKLIPAELRRVRPSDVETLLVSGNVDFSTPAAAATEELLPYLRRGRQVLLREFGHTGDVWGLQPPATRRLLTTFFATGVADDSLFAYQPLDFHVGLGLPEMAKIGLTVIVAAPLVGAVLVWLLVRRRSRRKRADQR